LRKERVERAGRRWPMVKGTSQKSPAPGKYMVVGFIRVDPEDPEPLTYREALKEKEHMEFLQPENIYRIEKLEGD